ncbi:hypothetical protein ACFXGR_22275 [Streptomyces mirabilis]|uniref:hypothetical protein n=1 Tax=Streptomyces mirabilis TaxID=68239 RepID=UPI0036CEF793
MTAPVPAPRLSPIAGLFNSLVAWLNNQLTDRVLLLEAELAVAIAENQHLKGTP